MAAGKSTRIQEPKRVLVPGVHETRGDDLIGWNDGTDRRVFGRRVEVAEQNHGPVRGREGLQRRNQFHRLQELKNRAARNGGVGLSDL